jgi:hypothetical protein
MVNSLPHTEKPACNQIDVRPKKQIPWKKHLGYRPTHLRLFQGPIFPRSLPTRIKGYYKDYEILLSATAYELLNPSSHQSEVSLIHCRWWHHTSRIEA